MSQYSSINLFNIADYTFFRDVNFMNFNPYFFNPWSHINTYLKPNIENIPFVSQEMFNGLYRQFKIYEDYK